MAGEEATMTRSTLKQRLLVLAITMAVAGAIGVPRLSAQQQTDTTQPAPTKTKSHASQPQQQQDRGEVVFMNNCSRCHMPPSGIPQRITGTIVMHMRVRAKLSRADEQALLRFFAP
jgi:mono/diheme cytochrome c family protein